MRDEKTFVIDVHLSRGLVALLILAALLGIAVWNQQWVAASAPQAPAAVEMRYFYLTNSTAAGADADTACGSGYHMASLWEILDPSNLRYNPDLGYTRADSAEGPPTVNGWVRTGYASASADSVGQSNCSTWTSSSSGAYGTYVGLPVDWTAGSDIHVWNAGTFTCDSSNVRVWCVED